MGAMALASLTACSNSQGVSPDYNTVVDIPILGWSASDTLFFPIQVTSPATIRTPLQVGKPYMVDYSIRMTSGFELDRVPMHLILQQTDTAEGGYTRIIRNVLRQDIAPAVRDSIGKPLGNTWGSLIDYESHLNDLTLRFDSTGTYRLMLIPATGSIDCFTGLSAIGLTFYRQ